MDWLTYSGGTDRPSELCYNFQTTILRWLTFLLGSLTVILTVLLFWIYFFLLTLVFVLQMLSLHLEILIMLLSQFTLTFHHISITFHAPFHRIAYDYSCADLDGLCDHLRDVPWEDIFKLLLVNFVSGFRLELMYISLLKSIRSTLNHPHGFQLLVLLP